MRSHHANARLGLTSPRPKSRPNFSSFRASRRCGGLGFMGKIQGRREGQSQGRETVTFSREDKDKNSRRGGKGGGHEPVSAIHTTETALGTRASYCPRWSLASRKPKADDFIEVSIAIVRHVTCHRSRFTLPAAISCLLVQLLPPRDLDCYREARGLRSNFCGGALLRGALASSAALLAVAHTLPHVLRELPGLVYRT